jgi:predicted transcriptional regulator
MVYSQSNSKNSPLAPVTLTKTVQPIAFLTPIIDYTSFYQKQSIILNQTTRLEIYTFIKDKPGTYFRDICDELELSVGVVQYHLRLLTKAKLISIYDDNRYKRFFQSGRLKESEMRLIALLRHKTAGRILLVLSKNQSISHQSLASKLGISSQALSWQMSRLRKMGVVDTVRERMTVEYFVTGKNVLLLSRCISLVNLR